MNNHCAECGERIDAPRRGKEFCSPDHRRAFNNRRASRGAELYDLAMTWRMERRPGGFSAMCGLISQYNASDRERQTPSYNHYRWGDPIKHTGRSKGE